MQEGLNRHISLEGERGTGKSTLAKGIISHLEDAGTGCVLNRELPEQYRPTSSLNQPESVELYELWEQQFITKPDNKVIALDAVKAELIAYQRFQSVVVHLLWEGENLHKIFTDYEVYLCDRDIDTVVAYGAAEIILSNPHKYKDPVERTELVKILWKMVLSVRELPETTFYLTTNNLKDTLQRSHLSKIGSTNCFELTPLQEAMQLLVNEIFPIAMAARPNLHNKRLIMLSVDGKNPEEVKDAVIRFLSTKPYIKPIDKNKNLLLLRYEQKWEAPRSLEELAQQILESSTGAAFPSMEEVHKLGFSNCVYNNAALAYYAREFGLGNLHLVSVVQDHFTDKCPVHWVCLQLFDDGTGRILDATPFNKSLKLGYRTSVTQAGNSYILDHQQVPLDGQLIAIEVQMEEPNFSFRLMEYAHQIQTSTNTEFLIREGTQLISNTRNESQEVFVTIRYLRLLEMLQNYAEAENILERLSNKYQTNLVVGREIARLAIQKRILPNALTYLNTCMQIINQALDRMTINPNISAKEIESFINYYSWIYQALDF